MNGISFFGKSDVGCVRKNNEDTFVVQHIWDQEHLLAVVVDGVGGYEGGEVAAAIARDSIVEYLEKYPNGERLELLKQAVISANNRIVAERTRDEKLSHMSCVLTSVLIELAEFRVNMAHVGDTRLYQYAHGKLRKLSHDQSVVGYLEDNGMISEEEAMHHPQRNIITQDVGSARLEASDNEYVETASFPLVASSSLLLCSDGLSDLVCAARMRDVLSMDITAEEKTDTLIEDAKKAGGKDNVTVVVVDVALENGVSVPAEKENIAEEADAPASPASPAAAADSAAAQQQSQAAMQPAEHSIQVPEKKRIPRMVYILVACALIAGVAVGFVFSGLLDDDTVAPAAQQEQGSETPAALPSDSCAVDSASALNAKALAADSLAAAAPAVDVQQEKTAETAENANAPEPGETPPAQAGEKQEVEEETVIEEEIIEE